jgi:hypothetical protein
VLLSAVVTAVLATAAQAAPAFAAPVAAGQTVTATGMSQVRVTPTNRKNNASIVAAVAAARQAGIAGAINDARANAERYATAVGLTLGSVISVSDAQTAFGYYGPFGGPFGGSFGPNQYCGTIRQGRIKVIKGRRRFVLGKKVRRCFVPGFEDTTLTLTYSTS